MSFGFKKINITPIFNLHLPFNEKPTQLKLKKADFHGHRRKHNTNLNAAVFNPFQINVHIITSYRNQSIGLHCTLVDWFLYDMNIDLN